MLHLFCTMTVFTVALSGEVGSVIELDFYHAASLLPISDEAMKNRALSVYLPACAPVRKQGSVCPPSSLPVCLPACAPVEPRNLLSMIIP